MSGLPLRSVSNASQRASGERSKPSITWLPAVTGLACDTDTGAPAGMGRVQMFELSLKTEYARRWPSAERLIACALSPVVSRVGVDAGVPDRLSATRETSRPPARFDTKRSARPRGS